MPFSQVSFSNDHLQNFTETVISTYLETNPTWSMMIENGNVKYNKKGKNVVREFHTGSGADVHTIGPFTDMGTIRAPRDGYRLQGTWEWGEYVISDVFDGQTLSRCGGESEIRDTLKTRTKKMNTDLKLIMADEVMNGDGTASGGTLATGGNSGTRWLGITQAIVSSPSSGTYAGIDRASYTGWRNYQVAGTGGPTGSFATDVWYILNLAANNTEYDWEGGKSRVDLLLFTRTNFTIYQNRALNQNTNLAVGDPGKEGMRFNGMVHKIDDNVAASTILGLNMSTWEFWTPDSVLFKTRSIDNHPGYNIGSKATDIQIQGAMLCLSPRNNFIVTSAA